MVKTEFTCLLSWVGGGVSEERMWIFLCRDGLGDKVRREGSHCLRTGAQRQLLALACYLGS